MFFTFPEDARWDDAGQAVEFGVEIGEYRGLVRVPRRVFQRLLPDRPTPERCLEAYYLQRIRFERIAERKLRCRQLADDGNVEITGRDLRAGRGEPADRDRSQFHPASLSSHESARPTALYAPTLAGLLVMGFGLHPPAHDARRAAALHRGDGRWDGAGAGRALRRWLECQMTHQPSRHSGPASDRGWLYHYSIPARAAGPAAAAARTMPWGARFRG